MISIIICSRNSDISPVLKENIESTIGVNFELIVIDNSKHDYSIFSAYNNGVSRSRFPFLCFVHEDVCFHTKDWGKNLINHLSDKKTGIIGIAGGQMMTRIPAAWSVGGRYKNIIQHKSNGKSISLQKEPKYFSGIRHSAILLDGVFLSLRSELFHEIKFNEELTGFHGYDHDISVQSIMAGYNNYVVFDILLEHLSEGNMNAPDYSINLIKVYIKWKDFLPLFSPDIPKKVKTNVEKTEIRLLGKLIRRMTRAGFSIRDIITNVNFFVDTLGTREARKQVRFIRFKIFVERLIHAPQYLFKQLE